MALIDPSLYYSIVKKKTRVARGACSQSIYVKLFFFFKILGLCIAIKPSACYFCFVFCQLFSFPPIPAPLKNAIDWASRPPNVWADKAAAIVSAGGGFGGGRSQYHLRQIGVYIDLHFINKPEFFLNVFQPPAKFDSDGNLVDESIKERLKEVLISLQAFTLRLQGKL